MSALRIINTVQDADRCFEGLHAMHTDDAVLVRGAICPIHLGQWSNLGNQIRQVGAPKQLK